MTPVTRCRLLIFCLLGLGLAVPPFVSPAVAQQPEYVAVKGQPFGVARVSIRMADEEQRFSLQENDGRALYPAVAKGRVRGALRRFLGVDRQRNLNLYFLFQGDAPLKLTVFTPERRELVAKVTEDAATHDELLSAWWDAYTREAAAATRSGAYPPIVQDYLVNNLARRLSLTAPAVSRRDSDEGDGLGSTIGLLLGTESIRAAMQKETLLGQTDRTQKATLPLPTATSPPEVPIPEPARDVQIEPLAMHVPVECFYIRFGNFTNYIWLREFIEQWGGETRNLLAQRGLQYGLDKTLQRQLAVRETALDKILGPTSIDDLALIGNDTFLREGASIGVVIKAKNKIGLSTGISSLRALTLSENKDATEETVTIAGHEVKFLSTPDNRVRSFHAVDGDYHLITTSRTLVRRFFEAGAGQDVLGASREFRYARTRMPLSRKDTVFVYLSDPFFRQFVGPQYRIEMTRRLQAATDAELVQLAQLAARAENKQAQTIDELVAADLLPKNFGQRPDGSQPVLSDGRVYCSLRGAYGTFLPVTDVPVQRVTPSEREAYQHFAEQYRNQWRSMDPAMIGIQRKASRTGGERVALDVLITPYSLGHYNWLSSLVGEPTRKRLKPVPGDVVSAELVVGAGTAAIPAPDKGHHLFAGIRNAAPEFVVRRGEVRPADASPLTDVNSFFSYVDSLHAYAGSWPSRGYLGFVVPNVEPDEDGYGRGDFFSETFWFRQAGNYLALSTQRGILEDVVPKFEMVDAERPAQVRLQIGELATSNWSKLLDALGYSRARKSSLAGAGLMNVLAEQLRVPRDQCQDVAERLLGAQLVCVLGGKYELVQHESGLKTWTTSALPEENRAQLTRIPPDYRMPLLRWFRGIEAELSLTDDTLSAHAEIEIGRLETSGN